jgi:hypothetical protein
MMWPLLARYLVAIAVGYSWGIRSPLVAAWTLVLFALLWRDLRAMVRRLGSGWR